MTIRAFFLPSWEQRKKLLIVEAWGFTAILYILFLYSALFPHDFENTETTYVLCFWVAFLIDVFRFHIGLLVTVLTAGAMLTRYFRLTIALVPLLIFCLMPDLSLFMPRSNPPSVEGEELIISSINLLMINKKLDPIVHEINRTQPDVIAFQEYSPFAHGYLESALKNRYPHRIGVAREDSFGTAVYSRLPFVGKSETFFFYDPAGIAQVRVPVQVGQEQLILFNTHLLPPRRLDYTIEHRKQFVDLIDRLKREKEAVLVVGDFNFLPRSEHAALLHEIGYSDSHSLAGSGRGATWPINSFFRFLPGIRLDHIWLNNKLVCLNSLVGPIWTSDHRPVSARLLLPEPAPDL